MNNSHDPIIKIALEIKRLNLGYNPLLHVSSSGQNVKVTITLTQNGERVDYTARDETLAKAKALAITKAAGKMDELPPESWEGI